VAKGVGGKEVMLSDLWGNTRNYKNVAIGSDLRAKI
jgi:hypothetical protein